MAQGGGINQRIFASGLDEIRRGLSNVGSDAEKSGNQVREALTKAIAPAREFGAQLKDHEVSARAARYAVQNLTFQINDVVTSLASGISPFRTFTQQGGQFVQLFQQGGGVGKVLGDFATRLSGLLTPLRLFGAGAAGVGAVLAALETRAVGAADQARELGVAFKGLEQGIRLVGGQNAPGQRLFFPTQAARQTVQDLSEINAKFRDIGLTRREVTDQFLELRRAGILPTIVDFEKLVRTGQNMNAVLGPGANTKFFSAVSDFIKGNEQPLTELARQFGVLGRNQTLAQAGLGNVTAAVQALNDKVQGLHNQSLNPIQKDLQDINVRFGEIFDRGGNVVDSIFTRMIHSTKEATVNAVEAENAFEDLAIAFAKAVARGDTAGLNRGFDALKSSISDAGTAFVNFFQKDFQNISRDITPFLANIKLPVNFGQFGTDISTFAQTLKNTFNEQIGTDPFGLAAAAQTSFDAIVKVFASQNPFADLEAWAKSVSDNIVNYFANSATSIWNSIKNLGQGAPVASATIPLGGGTSAGVPDLAGSGSFASGGLVRGAGTGTSDSILARVSAGEFVVNAAATRANYSLLHAINSMNRPVMPRSRSGFAMGGLVTSGGGGRAVNIVIGDRVFGGLSGPDRTLRSLERAASDRRMNSAGRRPGSQS